MKKNLILVLLLLSSFVSQAQVVSRDIVVWSNTWKPANGWIADALDHISVNLTGTGKVVIVPPIRNKSASFFTSKGFGIYIGSGRDPEPNGEPQRDGIPYELSGVFNAVGFVGENGKAIGDWNDTDFTNFGNRIANGRVYKYTFDSYDEGVAGPANTNISNLTHPQAWYKAQRAVGVAMANKGLGQMNFGSYHGDVFVTRAGDPAFSFAAQLRPSLTNNQTALTNNRPGGLHSHRQTPAWDADYSPTERNLFQYKHVILNKYMGLAGTNGRSDARFAEFICNSLIARNALNALGNTTAKICSFIWLDNAETGLAGSGFTAAFRRNVPVGGVAVGLGFPTYSYEFQRGLSLFSIILDDVVWDWDEFQFWGEDPNVVPNNSGEFSYTGPASRADPTLTRFVGGVVRPYPLKPMGGHNALPEAAKIYEKMFQWNGSTTFNNAKLRKKGTSLWQNQNRDAIVDAFLGQSAYCLVSNRTDGKRPALALWSFAPTTTTYEIDFNNDNAPDLEINAASATLYAKVVDMP